MHRIDLVEQRTAAVTDLLNGTSLDGMPSDGFLRIYMASTVDTATIEIDPALHASPTGSGTQTPIKRANGEIRAYDPHWELAVVKGEKVVIGIAGTTGTYFTWVSFVGKHG